MWCVDAVMQCCDGRDLIAAGFVWAPAWSVVWLGLDQGISGARVNTSSTTATDAKRAVTALRPLDRHGLIYTWFPLEALTVVNP